jgi:DNA (cytosine-5)-methyltransferase 1
MDKTLKVFESFAGIGSQRKALQRIGIKHTVVGISEKDENTVKSYMAIHGKTKNYGDITKINPKKLPDFNLFTYSFPCQDISTAGMGRGMLKEGGLTRSGLLYYALEINRVKLPEYALFENVKNLLSKKFTKEYKELLAELEFIGYNTYYIVLNANDFDVPHRRERVFGLSIRKDVDKGDFKWPEPLELKTKLRDLLEYDVPQKYYISEENRNCLIYNKQECVPGRLLVRENTSKGYVEAYPFDGIRLDHVRSTTGRGRIQHQMVGTLTTGIHTGVIMDDLRFRYLTPLECWRLMNFDDEDFYKAKAAGVSDSQLYKQAGNSIVVKVLEEIFRNLLTE